MRNIVYFLLLIFVFSGLHAANEQSKLKAITNKISVLQKHLFSSKKKKTSVSAQLEAAEQKIARQSLLVRKTDRKIAAVKKQLNTLTKKKNKLNRTIAKQKAALAEQLRVLYENGQQSYLKLLLNQEDPNQMERMAEYFKSVNYARAALIESFNHNLKTVTTNQQAINRTLIMLTELKQQQLHQQHQLQRQQNVRKALLAQLNKKIHSSKQRIARLQADKKRLQNIINNLKSRQTLEGKNFAKLKGKLRWPVKGKIIRKYQQIYDGRLASNGVFIATGLDQQVYTVAEGKVIFAKYLRGYGNLVIILHNGNYMSLYAHNNALLVQDGDTVKARELIALAGNSGGLVNPGLYFEIRYRGKPRNPALWCR